MKEMSTLTEIYTLGRNLLNQHGLTNWEFGFDNAKRRLGQTDFQKQKISLSRYLCPLLDPKKVQEVILHEIAHALVGKDHGHDAVWKAKCVEIGAVPRARMKNAPQLTPLWQGTCPQGHKYSYHRKPKRVQSCGKCCATFSRNHLIQWENTQTQKILRIGRYNYLD